MNSWLMLPSCALIAIAGSNARAPESPAGPSIPFLPRPVASDGAQLVAFEVVSGTTIGFKKVVEVSIIDKRTGAILVRYDRSQLQARLSEHLPSAKSQRFYFELNLRVDVAPQDLIASVRYLSGGGIHELRSPPVPFDTTAPVELGPPLRGGPWVAVHHPSWPRGHRRVVLVQGGVERIPGRYAVDWVGVDAEGRTTTGDADRPGDAVGYGAEVLAGADGRVEDMRDGVLESDSITGNPAKSPAEGSGNYVALRIGPKRYAIYEHLKPGSIRVRRGERVKTGQVIARLGFTGSSTGPHLHLHVADCASPIACEGVPFLIRGMTERGRYSDLGNLGVHAWNKAAARGKLRPEWPGYNVVISFED